jgi:acetolactate synthase-1/2/3 large subunit
VEAPPCGLFSYDGETVTKIDDFPCSGLSVANGRLFRLSGQRAIEGAEILVYDRGGVVRFARYAEMSDPHNILALDDGTVLVVSTFDNAIVALDRDGTATTFYRAADAPDAWHLNCITRHEGRIYATAFGRFSRSHQWQHSERDTGILFDVASGEDVITGLMHPHSPLRDRDAWLVCDSGTDSVLRIRDGHAPERVDVGGFSRGMCIVDDRVYVAVSRVRATLRNPAAVRHPGPGWLSVIDRADWREVERVPMPCSSMGTVLEVDDALLSGLHIGFRFGTRRERVLGQLAMFEQVGIAPRRVWAIGEPLDPTECRVRITGTLPEAVRAGAIATIDVTVENTGAAFYVPAPPNPVELCYRWFAGGVPVGAGTWLHTPLPRTLPPGDRVEFKAQIEPPPVPGRFLLRVTLLQEGIVWFDDVAPENALSGLVDVQPGTIA